jgi:hypothetical protein
MVVVNSQIFFGFPTLSDMTEDTSISRLSPLFPSQRKINLRCQQSSGTLVFPLIGGIFSPQTFSCRVEEGVWQD